MSVFMKDVHIANCKIGISSDGPLVGKFENVTFSNVNKPFDIKGAADLNVSGTRIINQPATSREKSMVGYLGRNGPPLPAYCPKCHSIFPSRNYDIGSSIFYGFDNEEVCQNLACGYEHALLAQGLFDLAKKAIAVIQAEPLTYAMIDALHRTSGDFLNGSLTAEEAASRIENFSSGLSSVFLSAWEIGIGAATIMAVYFMVMTSHLSAVQEFLGQEKSDYRTDFQIERICLEAFGEAAKCKITIEPMDDGGESFSRAQKSQVSTKGPRAPSFAEDAGTEVGDDVFLPVSGPVPKFRPSQ